MSEAVAETFQVTERQHGSDRDLVTGAERVGLRFETRETESPGWVWCTDDPGEAWWVPERWVEIEGDSCVMKRHYNSAELAVDVGEVVTVELEESGWAWARKESGESGWVPLDELDTEP